MSSSKNRLKSANKILVMDLLYLGDLIFATPFFRNLRRNFPEAEIDLIANSNFARIVDNNPHLNHVYSYDKNWSIQESFRFGRKLSNNNYDLGLNIHGNWRTVILMKIINPDLTIGAGERGKGMFMDQQFSSVPHKHMVQVYLNYLKELGLKVTAGEKPELKINQEAREQVRKFLLSDKIDENDEKLIGLNTGGSWPTKRWNKDSFAELAERLQRKNGNRVLFMGGPGDIARVNEIIEKMEIPPLNTAGQTSLEELVALTAECDLVISGDSGPVHVAAAVGTPTITLFGPSDERKYRPYGSNHEIITNEIDCRPCGEHHCPLEHHNCMEGIRVEDVIEKIREDANVN